MEKRRAWRVYILPEDGAKVRKIIVRNPKGLTEDQVRAMIQDQQKMWNDKKGAPYMHRGEIIKVEAVAGDIEPPPHVKQQFQCFERAISA